MPSDVRLPPWLKTKLIRARDLHRIRAHSYGVGLHTVCREAACPNQSECARKSTAVFMILGKICTRNCMFCAVISGIPTQPDEREPERVASSISQLGIRHAVITSVTRDDLEDGGAQAFVETIQAVRYRCPNVTVEVLVPDFQGIPSSIHKVIDAKPEVFNHNLETVPRLYPVFRPQASYRRSLEVLRTAGEAGLTTKSGIMVGVGENRDELTAVFSDLAELQVDIVTIGQYLRPSKKNIPVVEYVHPDQFTELSEVARSQGISYVFSGPLVRSSYNAAEHMELMKNR